MDDLPNIIPTVQYVTRPEKTGFVYTLNLITFSVMVHIILIEILLRVQKILSYSLKLLEFNYT